MALPKTVTLIEAGIDRGLHRGAQLYVSLAGETVADLAVGEARPGRAMRADDLALWLSSTKPTAAVALARLWEAGELELDHPVARFIPEFAAGGKAAVTLRHLLTHTSGIRMLDVGWPRESWEAIVARIAARRLEPRWDPGRKAGYHLASSWFILGEVMRRIDGRPYERFLREEVFLPLGMEDSWVGMPPERYRAYGDRIVPVFNTELQAGLPAGRRAGAAAGAGRSAAAPSGRPAAEHRWHREEWVTRPSPGGNGRGPIRELGLFYETLLAGGVSPETGRRVLTPQTVEALTARHRVGLYDHTFRHVMDWGLGFIVNSASYGRPEPDTRLPYAYGPHASRRTYGHSGYRSSTAFADPEHRLAVALATNGTPADGAHLERMESLCAAIYEDLGLAT